MATYLQYKCSLGILDTKSTILMMGALKLCCNIMICDIIDQGRKDDVLPLFILLVKFNLLCMYVRVKFKKNCQV